MRQFKNIIYGVWKHDVRSNKASKLENVKRSRNKNSLSCKITQSSQENLIIQERQSLTNHSVLF